MSGDVTGQFRSDAGGQRRHRAAGVARLVRVSAAMAIGSAIGVVATATSASAATTPLTTCTQAGLQAALTAGGSYTFNCGASSTTITLTSPLTVGPSVTVSLDGTGQGITISGNHATELFNVSGGSLTLVGYDPDGGGRHRARPARPAPTVRPGPMAPAAVAAPAASPPGAAPARG